jgi:O-acetyl-ADP-ribose deacetylase (regulator of RNase III)
MITYKKGNVALADESYIAHGCNAQGVMGSGVAKAIREQYPLAYEEYVYFYAKKQLYLGDVIPAICGNKAIFNCITQKFYGNDGKVYADIPAIHMCFWKLNGFGVQKLAIPKVGCGLGGLTWDVVEPIIAKNALNYDVVVYEI